MRLFPASAVMHQSMSNLLNKMRLQHIGGPLLEGLLVLLCLLLIGLPVQAKTLPAESPAGWLNVEFDESPLWQEPALYSLRVMSVGITGLVGLDLHDADPAVENFRRAWDSPAPRRDDDGPVFNLVLHPLWGSETYLRARSAGMTSQDSFAFSMTASLVWEYLIESWTEHPSSQDLVYTTGIGWMIGEGRHRLLQRLDPAQRVLADPLYSLVNTLDLNARMDESGQLTPLLGLGWDF